MQNGKDRSLSAEVSSNLLLATRALSGRSSTAIERAVRRFSDWLNPSRRSWLAGGTLALLSWPQSQAAVVLLGLDSVWVWRMVVFFVLLFIALAIWLGLRQPRPISAIPSAQALLERASLAQSQEDSKLAAWLLRQALDNDLSSPIIFHRLQATYWEIAMRANREGQLSDAQLYLNLIEPGYYLYPQARELLGQLVQACQVTPEVEQTPQDSPTEGHP